MIMAGASIGSDLTYVPTTAHTLWVHVYPLVFCSNLHFVDAVACSVQQSFVMASCAAWGPPLLLGCRNRLLYLICCESPKPVVAELGDPVIVLT